MSFIKQLSSCKGVKVILAIREDLARHDNIGIDLGSGPFKKLTIHDGAVFNPDGFPRPNPPLQG
jgi:hypothetical protein